MAILSDTNSVFKANTYTKVVNKYAYQDEHKQLSPDQVVVELPLQIGLQWQQDGATKHQIFTITMRTPGHDQQLIIGLLFCEGIIKSINDIEDIAADKETDNQWQVKLAAHCQPQLASLERFQLSYSSCGLCGTTSLKSLEFKDPPKLSEAKAWLDSNLVYQMPDTMRAKQSLFQITGGVHAAALFDQQGKLLIVNEDIGRHNAIDKLVGTLVLNRQLTLGPSVLVVSSRVSFEIVQKAIMAGISVLIAIGAPTELAINAAKRFNLTLIGFASAHGFNLYHGHWRIKHLPEETKCQKT